MKLRSIVLCGVLTPFFLLVSAGCQHHNTPPTGIRLSEDRMDESKAAHRVHLVTMADNAMLRDMSLADVHFVPHTAELSGTGVHRLGRMAPMLDTYGGIVRYETYIDDEALVDARLESVREYLALMGCNMDRLEVRQMISGGSTMPASKAIEVMETGTNRPQGQPDPSQAGFGLPAK